MINEPLTRLSWLINIRIISGESYRESAQAILLLSSITALRLGSAGQTHVQPNDGSNVKQVPGLIKFNENKQLYHWAC